ncbi:hypothetical protein FISHEDRAFT_57907 [Fistulina hepatica ATCC 64428]|uniref:Uncharacterized protein n=1 Tax=Fistulina hepatica ATCC 64428 TaxID=1128425 RepID=A0A0D7ADV7_9AGAR|nr:hypothetical protein FISHEDRAFT_57907 [Fistulina hepatica ATCC 64428]
MANIANIVVWCLLIDRGKKCMALPFRVWVPLDAIVNDLKKEVKKDNSDLNEVAIRNLVVWRCKEPKLFIWEKEEWLVEHIKGINFKNKAAAVELPVTVQVASLGLQPEEVLVVQLSSAGSVGELQQIRY